MSPKTPSDTIAFLRDYLASHPDDLPARMRLASLLAVRGERPAARALLEPIEHNEGPLRAQITADLAVLDEEEGRGPAAVARWQRLLADDVDHPEACAHLARLRAAGLGGAPPAGSTAPPTLASPEGVTLLRYEIVRELGRGGSSTVYLARDQSLDMELALKILHPHLAARERSSACHRFFHEARVAAGLRHRGVVAIYDLDEDTRTLVMEHLPGGTLRDRLRNNPRGISADEVRTTAAHLLAALSHVHARGIIHGDITPRNVLLRRPGDPVLADFGNAVLLEAPVGDQPAGTPIYLAPEQFRGAPASAVTDLFSTGALLWELRTGQPMRQHGDLIANRFAPPPLPATIGDAALGTLLRGLTEAEPGRRPPSAAAALSLLDR